MLKMIQLGLTFSDAEGNLPRINNELCVWQFNFREFRLQEDLYAQDSIELLKQSGIDFAQNESRGVSLEDFGALLVCSGVVLNEDVRWLTFHSGYDFGYLLRTVTAAPLPSTEADFFELLNVCVLEGGGGARLGLRRKGRTLSSCSIWARLCIPRHTVDGN